MNASCTRVFGTDDVSKEAEYGAVVSLPSETGTSGPFGVCRPKYSKSTRATATLSLAVAETFVVPRRNEPACGCDSVTDGCVVSAPMMRSAQSVLGSMLLGPGAS